MACEQGKSLIETDNKPLRIKQGAEVEKFKCYWSNYV